MAILVDIEQEQVSRKLRGDPERRFFVDSKGCAKTIVTRGLLRFHVELHIEVLAGIRPVSKP